MKNPAVVLVGFAVGGGREEVAVIRECRHDDDLARCEAMLLEGRSGWLYGLDRAFTRAERGTLLVEVRNLRCLLAIGRMTAKPKGPRFDPTRMPDAVLLRLIQTHTNARLVEALRAERQRRGVVASHAGKL